MPDSDQAWDTHRHVRRGQGWLVTLGILALLPAVVATVLRVAPPTDDGPALWASFIPYALVFWLPALLLIGVAALRARRSGAIARISLLSLTMICLVGLLATVAWQAPEFVPNNRPVTTEPLTIASLNVRAGSADTSEVVEQTVGADVVTFVEAPPGWVDALPLQFREAFPYAVGAPLQSTSGSIIFSRYPITSSEALPASSFQQWSAIVDTPQLGPLRVVAVHPCNPFCGPGLWTAEHTELRHWLARQDDTPTVVAGDFNAVDDHAPMRDVYADGWRSAADLAGAGYARTYPADWRFPPLIGIDHILLNDRLTATAFTTFKVPGTDHLGVRAVIAGTTGTARPTR
ncbi:MAG TPA: endonuclease/exonuclease/phosphatase family protein [Microlunatus sp.]